MRRDRGLRRTLVVVAAAAFSLIAPPAAHAAYTATLSGSAATLTDSAGASANVAVFADGVYVAHSLTGGGFNSPRDWDSSVAGTQALINQAQSSVTIVAGDGDDSVSIGREELASPPVVPGSWASAVSASVAFHGGEGTDRLALDNAGDPTARSYGLTPTTATGASPGLVEWSLVDELRVLAGGGNDVVTASGVLPKTNVYAGPGDDRLRFAKGARLSGGIADGGTGTDRLDYAAYTTEVTVDLGAETAFVAEPMTGANERPTPNPSRSTGTMIMRYDGTTLVCDLDTASRHLDVSRMTGAHLHRGTSDAAGPIVVNLDGNLPPNNLFTMVGGLTTRSKGFTLPAAEADDLHAGGVYVNLHSTDFPGGEIRGQVVAAGQAGPATGTGWQARFERVTGGSASDVITGGAAANELRGGPGGDRLSGEGGDDSLYGDGDADVITPGTGRDLADGGGGAYDTFSYEDRAGRVAVKLDGIRNDGTDTNGNGTSSNTEEADLDIAMEWALGGNGNDRLTGSALANQIIGGAGNDVLDGLAGADTLDGAGGTDTITYASRTGPVAVKIDKIRNDGADPNGSGVSTASEEGDLDIAIENVTGGTDTDLITGSNGPNALLGGPGDDRITPRLGRDSVDGGTGSDAIMYRERTSRVAVTLDGLRNDGLDPDADGFSEAGEEADQDIAVEEAEGGSSGDELIAEVSDAVVNRLFGNAGADLLSARELSTTEDELYCGDGEDIFDVDETDIAGEDCEIPQANAR